jgi:hypothetical protein
MDGRDQASESGLIADGGSAFIHSALLCPVHARSKIRRDEDPEAGS